MGLVDWLYRNEWLHLCQLKLRPQLGTAPLQTRSPDRVLTIRHLINKSGVRHEGIGSEQATRRENVLEGALTDRQRRAAQFGGPLFTWASTRLAKVFRRSQLPPWPRKMNEKQL